MDYRIQTLCERDVDLVHSYERALLGDASSLTPQMEMQTWSAPWRKEALEYYLPNGWCFGFFNDESKTLSGYFLAQPICFFRSLTQTLWMEHLQADTEELKTSMLDVAYRTARSKNLQSLIAYKPANYMEALNNLDARKLEDDLFLIKTTKHN